NLLFGPKVLSEAGKIVPDNIYDMVRAVRDMEVAMDIFAKDHGFIFQQDESGSNIDINIIDLSLIKQSHIHPLIKIDFNLMKEVAPVLLVMDYAFGTQAYDIMDELLSP